MKELALTATVLALGTATVHAAVTASPLDLTTGSAWRTGAPPSVETDQEYGSDGYVLFGLNLGDGTYVGDNFNATAANSANVYQLPTFATVAGIAGETFAMWSGNGNCGQIQNPAASNALTNAAALLRGPNPSANPVEFTITRTSDKAFRLTVMIGLFSDGGFQNNGFTLTVDAGAAGSATADTSAAPAGGSAGTPGVMYQTFAIDAGTDPIRLTVGPGTASHENIAGLLFDGVAVGAPSFTSQPTGATIVTGGPVTFTAAAVGSGVTYQWQRGTTDIPGATGQTLTFSTAAADNGVSFRCVATNAGGSVPSDPAVLTLVAPSPRTADYRAAVAAETSRLAFFPFDGDTGPAVTNTVNASYGGTIGLGAFTGDAARVVGTKALAGTADLVPDPAWELPDGSGTVEMLFYHAEATPAYNPALFSIRETPTNARISLHASANGSQLFFWNGANVAIWDTPVNTLGRRSHVAFVFDAGEVTAYFNGASLGAKTVSLGAGSGLPAQIAAADPAGGERLLGAVDELAIYEDPLSAATIQAHATAWFGAAPTVVAPPASQTVVDGGPAHFSISAQGPDLSYQWQKNNAPIPGATSSSLSIVAAAADTGATYRCIVTNTAGSATSDPATLTVVSPAPQTVAYRAAVAAEPSRIAYFPFDGDTGPGVTNTVAPAFGGTLRAGSFLTGENGRVAGTTALSGTAGLTLDPAWEFADDLTGTVEALVFQSSTAGYNPCFFSIRDGSGVRYSLHGDSLGEKLYLWNGSNVSVWTTPRNMIGRLSHVAVVFDNGSVTAYLDGRNLGTASNGLGFGSGLSCQIGSSTDGSGELWPGTVDEVAIYSDALSAAAVSTHANAWFGAPPSPVVTSVTTSSGLVFLTVPSASGFYYTLETTPDLVTPWQPVAGSGLDGTGADLVFSTALGGPDGYYRVRVSR